MIICKVVGNVVSTRKHEQLVGSKLLIVEPLSSSGDRPMVAVDNVGAGVGETVLVAVGGAARVAMGKREAPIDAAVVGIVDNADSLQL
ncbi:MAG: ethanolamine utilization protein EutN [Clostridiales bacterium]|nr:ethanolamine utilization protein EutN [Clostridiales bacterium]